MSWEISFFLIIFKNLLQLLVISYMCFVCVSAVWGCAGSCASDCQRGSEQCVQRQPDGSGLLLLSVQLPAFSCHLCCTYVMMDGSCIWSHTHTHTLTVGFFDQQYIKTIYTNKQLLADYFLSTFWWFWISYKPRESSVKPLQPVFNLSTWLRNLILPLGGASSTKLFLFSWSLIIKFVQFTQWGWF